MPTLVYLIGNILVYLADMCLHNTLLNCGILIIFMSWELYVCYSIQYYQNQSLNHFHLALTSVVLSTACVSFISTVIKVEINSVIELLCVGIGVLITLEIDRIKNINLIKLIKANIEK